MTKPMQKARSRLRTITTMNSASKSAPGAHSTHLKKTWRDRTTDFQKRTHRVYTAITVRLKYWPLLIMALFCYAGTVLLVTRVHPETIQHWVFPDSFLPFHILLFLSNFFFFTFLTVSKRWGVFLAISLQWLCILKLQNFLLDGWAFLSALALGIGGYWLRTSIKATGDKKV